MTSSRRLSVAALAAPLLTARCIVGPNFHEPAPPPVSTYVANPSASDRRTPGVPGGEAQRFVVPADIPAEWWTLFHSPALNALIQQALANNADLKAAQAAILVAHENTRAQRGAALPQVSAGRDITRQKDPRADTRPGAREQQLAVHAVTPQLSVSYVPDVFGLNKRRRSRRGHEQAAATRWSPSTSRSARTSPPRSSRSLARRPDRDDQRADRHSTARSSACCSIRSRRVMWAAPTVAQQAQLAQLEASLPPLLKQRDQQNNLLAVLTGDIPARPRPRNSRSQA